MNLETFMINVLAGLFANFISGLARLFVNFITKLFREN